ncbi:hypothetical protein [Frankia sp. Cppng1_Ct_nod]|uniref:hypothetical protein n=1 Tax=Frankia sp. Cppng1_Ct_nod TaxID=2897162 RepID=UPI0010419865|nr:hypothetical protein [Frankia sp. Cppng1_Ct_nod]
MSAGPSLGWHAYVDETESDSRLDPNTYMLAAAVGDTDNLGQTRNIMRELLQPGQRKLHWRDESDRRRHAIIEEVAGAPVEHLVVVYDGRQGEQSERRRKQCLKRLCYELDQMGVIRMVLESRGPADDQRDWKMIDVLRAIKAVSSVLRMDHLPRPGGAAAVAADAVCGAMTRARTGEPAFVKTIESRLTIISIGY